MTERFSMDKRKKNWNDEVEAILKELTLDEKIGMIHGAGLFRTKGVERLSIPPVKSSDGPMGVRSEFQNDKWIPAGTTDDFVTYLPSNSALAATWNKELAYTSGRILGMEARGRGKDVILAPGINIKRSPLCGRNFEYMSEDPKVIEELTVPFIQGIQENDVAACVKHFAANAQETDRLMVDTIVDERTLREIYLPGFKAAVEKAGTYSLMGAYNKLNGYHCCENKTLLHDILQEEWGYDGTVISDWGGVHKTKEAAEAPMDIEMSVFDNFDDYMLANPLKKAIESGELEEELVDKKVRNILRMMFRLKMIGKEKGERKSGTYNTEEHRRSVYETASESVVLLKNEDRALPIQKSGLKKIGVIGRNADMIHSNGGGSAEIKALYEISPLMGIKTRLGGNTEVRYAPGYFIPEKEVQKEENWQQSSLDGKWSPTKEELEKQELREQERSRLIKEQSEILLNEAVQLAKECDRILFVGGLNHDYDVEGQDRSSMELPYGQNRVIEAVLEANPEAVIVMVAGSPVEMPWKNKAKAIVWCYYAGMETGNALADILFGAVNPSGKLPETFPVSYQDTPTGENGEFGLDGRVEFKEGIFVGYRYYEDRKKETAFCFGHGLSYTTFRYQWLTVMTEEEEGDVRVKVSCIVENTGDVAGAEAVQLYISENCPTVRRPVKELKAFTKIFLEPGEKKEVEMLLKKDDFGYYDVEAKTFRVNSGMYTVSLGASVKDIRLKREFEIKNAYTYH